MERFACHCLYNSTEECHSKYVVELDENGWVKACFPLKREISSTQWVGGIIILSPCSELKLCLGESFLHFLRRAAISSSKPLYAWYIADFDFVKKELTVTSKLVRL